MNLSVTEAQPHLISNTCRVLEADPNLLPQLILELEKETPLYLYAQVLLAYHRGRVDELHKLLKETTINPIPLPLTEVIPYLIELRIAVRNLVKTEIKKLTQLPLVWEAEVSFVEAMYFETQGEDFLSEKSYKNSEWLFFKANVLKKSIKSSHNSLACKSRINPQLRQIPEYQSVLSRAKQLGDMAVAASALSNLSREFHIMMAHNIALQYANEAVDLLRKNAYGSYSFYTALCHRAQLNLESKRTKGAIIDFEEANCAPFPEIKECLKVLKDFFLEKGICFSTDTALDVKNPDTALLPTWKERSQLGILDSDSGLSDLQAKLIEALSSGPKDRHDLIATLWGESEDYFHLENRLKQLLHRIKKRNSSLIGFTNGKYFILEGNISV